MGEKRTSHVWGRSRNRNRNPRWRTSSAASSPLPRHGRSKLHLALITHSHLPLRFDRPVEAISLLFRSSPTPGVLQSRLFPPAKEEEEEYEYEEGNNTAEKKSEGEEGEEDDGVNKLTGEVGGPKGPEPTRYGDWERGGRCSDF
uniref:Succinate dehydrogenase assembly factor 4, mitochondrial n=1 Tax=Ananas comosus var. bracteatus TaxID=296719 RepID=A0A6V7QJR3_ANACO|nr:unnamed protein product [Ananas comosus var. bracteatus]